MALCRWLSVLVLVPARSNPVGTGVMGGMVTAMVLATFFVPVFFVVVRRRFSRKNEDIQHSHTVIIIDRTCHHEGRASGLFMHNLRTLRSN
ncbi:efflux RND transporter permease subunit [Shigella flexneri]